MYTIKKITAAETFIVRQPVLRPGKPIASCHFDGDNLPTTVHFGIFEDEELLGVASVFKAKHELFTENTQYQLRGMAVLAAQQKKGLGEKLIRAAEKHTAAEHGEILWFNAREVAVPFYKKSGYTTIGEPFNIADIGPHYVMFKTAPFN